MAKQQFYQVRLQGADRYIELWQNDDGWYGRIYDQGDETDWGPFPSRELAGGHALEQLITWPIPEDQDDPENLPSLIIRDVEVCDVCGVVTDGPPYCSAGCRALAADAGAIPVA